MCGPASRTACVKAFTLAVRVRKPQVLTAYLHWRFVLANRQCKAHLHWWLAYINGQTFTLAVELCEPPVILIFSGVFYVNRHWYICYKYSFFLPRPALFSRAALHRWRTWRSKNRKIQGGGFALHFFGGGGLRRLVNVSHSSFFISASHFELKLDLAREESFMLVFWERQREW